MDELPSIYIVDDDDAVRDSLQTYLMLKGMNVETFSSADGILNFEIGKPRVLILDVNMPDVDGFELLHELRARGLLTPVIFITGVSDPHIKLRAARAGAAAFLDKPIDPHLLLETLGNLLVSSGTPI